MSFGQIVLAAYALLMVLGGVMGARAGSKVSLIAGAGSGVMLGIALFFSFRSLRVGLAIGAVIALALTVSFLKRYVATKKMMPGGMLMVISLIAALLLGYSALNAG